MDPSSSSGFGVLGFVDPEEDNTNAIAFDFFSQPDSMPPPSNAAGGMEFFAQSQVHSSLVGHGNNFMVDLDLNSEAPDYPHLSTYQDIIQAEQMMPLTMDMIDGHIASGSGTGGRQSGKSDAELDGILG